MTTQTIGFTRDLRSGGGVCERYVMAVREDGLFGTLDTVSRLWVGGTTANRVSAKRQLTRIRANNPES
jgi:hypothetical protein